MKIIINFFTFIINCIDVFFNKILNRDFKGLIFDKLQFNFKKIKIGREYIKIYSPSSILNWRVKTYFSKEPETLKWIKKFKLSNKSKIIFWDIGANVGLYSLYSCFTHAKDIEVVSFEPSVNNLKSLATNISINNFEDQVKICSNPLNDKVKFSKLNESSFIEGSALNSFANNFDFEGKKFDPILSYQTFGLTLDYLIDNSHLKIPNYIKIDVDGNEHLILKGLKNNLSKKEICEIMIEINENYKEQLDSITTTMMQSNFKLADKFKASILDQKEDNFSKTYNYLFKKL